jgi:hypothetical protein
MMSVGASLGYGAALIYTVKVWRVSQHVKMRFSNLIATVILGSRRSSARTLRCWIVTTASYLLVHSPCNRSKNTYLTVSAVTALRCAASVTVLSTMPPSPSCLRSAVRHLHHTQARWPVFLSTKPPARSGLLQRADLMRPSPSERRALCHWRAPYL